MNRINTTLMTIKLIFSAWKKTIVIYLGIAFVLNILIIFGLTGFNEMDGEFHAGLGISGLTISNLIFVFILGITGFDEEFSVAVSMSISRRIYFIAHTCSLIVSGILLSAAEVVSRILLMYLSGDQFNHVLNQIPAFLVIPSHDPVSPLPFNTAVFVFIGSLGWLIRMLYFRANKIQKILLSLSPILLFILLRLPFYDEIRLRITNNQLFRFLFDIIVVFSTYIGTPSLFIMSILVFCILASIFNLFLCYLLIRRAPAA